MNLFEHLYRTIIIEYNELIRIITSEDRNYYDILCDGLNYLFKHLPSAIVLSINIFNIIKIFRKNIKKYKEKKIMEKLISKLSKRE